MTKEGKILLNYLLKQYKQSLKEEDIKPIIKPKSPVVKKYERSGTSKYGENQTITDYTYNEFYLVSCIEEMSDSGWSTSGYGSPFGGPARYKKSQPEYYVEINVDQIKKLVDSLGYPDNIKNVIIKNIINIINYNTHMWSTHFYRKFTLPLAKDLYNRIYKYLLTIYNKYNKNTNN